MSKFFFVVFTLLLSIFTINAANVEILAEIQPDKTIFIYQFYFSEEDNYNSFSFEKPKDSKILSAIDSFNKSLKYSVAGDYFIFRELENTDNNNYTIKFVSNQISEDIISKGSFSNYVNFNFPVDNLTYSIILDENLGEVEEFFPRNYEITNKGNIFWYIEEVKSDTLFLLNFDKKETTNNYILELLYSLSWILILTLLIIAFLIIFALVRLRKPLNKKDKENKDNKKERERVDISEVEEEDDDNKKEKSESVNDEKVLDKTNENLELDEAKYKEVVNKYLTDNEKDVVKIVKENSGISQYDILNFIPTMTKSNLSKIIAKLNSRKILSRIKVGKVNKIYLGEKLEKDNNLDKKDKN